MDIALAALATLPWSTLILALGVMAVGSAIQASVGIGLAFVVVPPLALLDPRFVPAPMLAAAFLLTCLTALRERRNIEPVPLARALAGLAIGTAIGAGLTVLVSGPLVPKVFGALVLAAVAVSVAGLKFAPTPVALLGAGTGAGVMGTMVGIHGPPIALVFQNSRPEIARPMLGAFFAVAAVIAVAAHWAIGRFGWVELALAVALVPGTLIGLAVAPRLTPLVDVRRLRLAILAISAISGVVLLVR